MYNNILLYIIIMMNNMIDISRKYSLNDFNNIIFNGFDFNVNEQVLKIISELAG